MRLSELNPKWVSLAGWSSEHPFYVGVRFDAPNSKNEQCPTCGHIKNAERIVVNFWPPIDPAGLLGTMFNLPDNNGHRRVSGDTFDTLTLDPSIGRDPLWHGHLINGELIPS